MRRLVSSMVIVLSLSACAGLKPFPAKTIWEYDRKTKTCGEYQIIAYDPRIRVKHLRDVPLDQCPAIFGFSAAEIAPVLDWSADALAYSKKRCR